MPNSGLALMTEMKSLMFYEVSQSGAPGSQFFRILKDH